MEGFLNTSRSNGTAVRGGGDAAIFTCRDVSTAELLCSRKELDGRCLRIDSERVVVPEEAESSFRKMARSLGFGVVASGE